MEQLAALAWLKWRLFVSQLRSSKALFGQIVSSALGMVVMVLAVSFGGLLFAWLYLVVEGLPGLPPLPVLLLTMLTALYLVWSMTALLPTRGGSLVDPSMLLHYPIRLSKLFAIDLVTEPFKGVALLLLPSLAGIHLAVPAAAGRPLWGLPPLLGTLLLGTLLMKTVESFVALLNRRGRNLGETLAASAGLAVLLVMVVGMVAAGEIRQLMLEQGSIRAAMLRATPMALTEAMLMAALRGDSIAYLEALGLFFLYLPPAGALCFVLWRRLVTGAGGARQRRSRVPVTQRPWALPGLSGPMSALLEKELKYLVRNPQVRMILLLPFVFLLFRLLEPPRTGRGFRPHDDPFRELTAFERIPVLEGLPVAVAVAYLFLFYGVLFNNLFGLDGDGMKSYLLAPIERQSILVAKNLALLLLGGAQAAILLGTNQVLFGDLGLHAVLTGVLSFLGGVAVMAGVGNLMSIYFPRRSDYGRRLEASRWSVVLTFAEVPVAMLPVILAFLLGYWTDRLEVRYAVHLAGTAGAVALYGLVLLPMASRGLERRETRILDTVTGGDE